MAVATLPVVLADWGDWMLLEPPAGDGALLPPPELQDSNRSAIDPANSKTLKLFINVMLINFCLSDYCNWLVLSA